jgi:hypothetical protein
MWGVSRAGECRGSLTVYAPIAWPPGINYAVEAREIRSSTCMKKEGQVSLYKDSVFCKDKNISFP